MLNQNTPPRVRVVDLLAIVLLGFALPGWIASYWYGFVAVWTMGNERSQIVSCNGTISLVQNHSWWRRENREFRIEPSKQLGSVVNWPGMKLDSNRSFAGFTWASGRWKSPYTTIPEGTKFTTPEQSVATGSILSITTPTSVYGVPYWFLVLGASAWLVFRRFRKEVPQIVQLPMPSPVNATPVRANPQSSKRRRRGKSR